MASLIILILNLSIAARRSFLSTKAPDYCRSCQLIWNVLTLLMKSDDNVLCYCTGCLNLSAFEQASACMIWFHKHFVWIKCKPIMACPFKCKSKSSRPTLFCSNIIFHFVQLWILHSTPLQQPLRVWRWAWSSICQVTYCRPMRLLYIW